MILDIKPCKNNFTRSGKPAPRAGPDTEEKGSSLETTAVVVEEPGEITLRRLELDRPDAGDVVVDVRYSGISTGTERLLCSGRMPPFPGLGYPLVPGYESVGRVREAGPDSGRSEGEWLFVPGARCYGEVRGLFGASADRLVVSGDRVVPVPEGLEERGVLLALAATAYHALQASPEPPELIVGHGALGRLLARLAAREGDDPPTVWETRPERRGGADYPVVEPSEDPRTDYGTICDMSGDPAVLDELVKRCAPGAEIVLAGFYDRVSFSFPPAFMREVSFRVAAEWTPPDLAAAARLVGEGELSLEGLVSHRAPARGDPEETYDTAFNDASCVKMVLDWEATA